MTPIPAHRFRLDYIRNAPPQLVEVGPVEVLPIYVDTDPAIAVAALNQKYPVNVPETIVEQLREMLQAQGVQV